MAKASQPESLSTLNQSGGVNVVGPAEVTVAGDVVGRDKIVGYTADQVSVLIEQIRKEFQPKPFTGRSPYVGLDFFSEKNADLFFGRERLVEQLITRVMGAHHIFIT